MSASGISTKNPEDGQVKSWPISKNAKKLHSFISCASYYWQFIHMLASIVPCLNNFIGPIANKHKDKDSGKTSLNPSL